MVNYRHVHILYILQGYLPPSSPPSIHTLMHDRPVFEIRHRLPSTGWGTISSREHSFVPGVICLGGNVLPDQSSTSAYTCMHWAVTSKLLHRSCTLTSTRPSTMYAAQIAVVLDQPIFESSGCHSPTAKSAIPSLITAAGDSIVVPYWR